MDMHENNSLEWTQNIEIGNGMMGYMSNEYRISKGSRQLKGYNLKGADYFLVKLGLIV